MAPSQGTLPAGEQGAPCRVQCSIVFPIVPAVSVYSRGTSSSWWCRDTGADSALVSSPFPPALTCPGCRLPLGLGHSGPQSDEGLAPQRALHGMACPKNGLCEGPCWMPSRQWHNLSKGKHWVSQSWLELAQPAGKRKCGAEAGSHLMPGQILHSNLRSSDQRTWSGDIRAVGFRTVRETKLVSILPLWRCSCTKVKPLLLFALQK